MKKVDVLAWGMKHIASNHGFAVDVNYQENLFMVIYGCNVPTLADVQMMCDDLEIPRDEIEATASEIGVYIRPEWTCGLLQQDYTPKGWEFWKKQNAVIGR